MYPVMLDLTGHLCLVVGGGGVALRKINALIDEGAVVKVVAVAANEGVGALAKAGSIDLALRAYALEEAAEYDLVFAATSDRRVNRQVFEDARGAGVWVNVADDPPLCTFQLPARVQRGSMQLAIASGGEAPFVVRRLRQLLGKRLGPEWAEWMDAAARFRREVRALELEKAQEEALFDLFFKSTIDDDKLGARVPLATELETMFASAGREKPREPGAGERHRAPLQRAGGSVSLVGAGPGDPGLLTVRGREHLMSCDAVVYDRLAATSLPCDLPARVELHCVGKDANRHPVPQPEINATLVRLARAGKRVVRLKGGDPFVFGRGGEEAEELVKEGIPFEIVPSVTAGVAVPAYAGIPVTNRGESVRLTMVTAHEALKNDGPQVRWDLLATDPHATLVGYMGVSCIDQVVRELLASGMEPSTPAAMIERGTTSRQRTVQSTVRDLPAAIGEAGIRPPALFVIGPTVRHAERLDWFGRRPHLGQRLLLPPSCAGLSTGLQRLGVETVCVPLPLSPASRVVMGALPLTGCVVGDPGDVDALDEERAGTAWSTELRVWCLGAKTGARALELGWTNVIDLPPESDAEALAESMLSRGLGAESGGWGATPFPRE